MAHIVARKDLSRSIDTHGRPAVVVPADRSIEPLLSDPTTGGGMQNLSRAGRPAARRDGIVEPSILCCVPASTSLAADSAGIDNDA
jgi:hypothetical protein